MPAQAISPKSSTRMLRTGSRSGPMNAYARVRCAKASQSLRASDAPHRSCRRSVGPDRYFSRGAWLEEEQPLRGAHRLSGIPAVLVHGRHDPGSPVDTAWQLAKAWPDARPRIIDDSGHTGSEAMPVAVQEALEEFKNR